VITRGRSEEFHTLVEGDPRRARSSTYTDLLDVVGALRSVPAPEADATFVASLRERLVAEAEAVLVAAAAAREDDQDRLTLRRTTARVRRHNRRVAAVVAGAVLVGGSATMAVASQSALPGDSLYPLKRGIENVHTDLTFDKSARGRLLLGDASTRLDEVAGLSRESDGSAQVGPTLDAFAQQAAEGSQLLVEDYQQTGDRSSITSVREFTAASMARLAQLQSMVPSDSLGSLLQAAQAVAQIQRTSEGACPSCAGPDVTKVPQVLTQSLQAAATSGHSGAPRSKPGQRLSSQTPLPHVGKRLPPASVSDPTQTGGSTGSTSTGGDVQGTLQNLTNGLTSRHHHHLGSTVKHTTGTLLDGVGQAGTTVGGAVGGTVSGVTGGIQSILPSVP
jgi:hypothetical protein